MPANLIRMGHTTKAQTIHATPQAQGVPLLPGCNFHDDPLMKRSLKKCSYMDKKFGAPTFVADVPTHFEPPIYGKIDPMEEGVGERLPTPPWLAQHNILRFNAYFKEPILESDVETVRIRKCVIYYHTEDRTILVRELSQVNSGMQQGVLIKRHCIPLDASEQPAGLEEPKVLGPEHFIVGQEVTVYGKRFMVIGVDSNTRNHLTDLGYTVPENMEWPADNQFEALCAKKAKRQQVTSEHMDMKRHHEYGATGLISIPSPRKVARTQKFLQHGGEKLKFMAAWDDRDMPHGDLRMLQINYFLEDDTIQVLEPPVNNSGREGCTKVVTRQRCPKVEHRRAFANEGLFDNLKKDAKQHLTFGVDMDYGYYTADDLAIGKVLDIHGRSLVLYDCDEMTRDWYWKERGIDLGAPINVQDYFKTHPKAPPRLRPPPHHGIGSEEDSLESWKNLMPKAPKRNHEKETKYAGKILSYALRMVPSPNALIEEEGRHFILSYYLENDTLSIGEIGINNSGLMGGKYLARQRVKRLLPDGSYKWYTPEDFKVGEVITVLSKQFRVLEMDSATEKFLGGIVDPSTPEDIKRLVVSMRDAMLLKHPRVQEAFRAIGGHTNNNIDVSDIIEFFRTINLDVKREDAKTIMSMFDHDGDGVLNYNEFVAMVQGDEYSLNMDELSNTTKQFKITSDDMFKQTQAYTRDAIQSAHENSVFTKKCEKLVTALRDKIAQRRCQFLDVFRVLSGHSLDSQLHAEDFRHGLKEFLGFVLSPEEESVLEQAFFPGGQPCNLQRFCCVLESDNKLGA
mmetsp:Transcript_108444/g.187353  ORF Transcript_108444/g.187353 Transcript_108444/m.187353 type:complete len:794 (-) Transcript_108444:735-3116(-)